MIRPLGILLGLALTAGAYAALTLLDPEARPEIRALKSIDQANPDTTQTIALLTEAVRRDPANPYRWSDLGGGLTTLSPSGQSGLSPSPSSAARAAYARALELSRDIPQIWLRDANFHFQLNEPEPALETASRVLKTVPDYDSVLFNYFTQFNLSPDKVLKHIGTDPRATRAYTLFLIDHNLMDAATTAWRSAADAGFNEIHLTSSYIDALLRSHRYDQAQRDWVGYLGQNRDGYPDRNLLFNASFELDPTSAAFDWRIQPGGEVETIRDTMAHQGQRSLRIRFPGNSNVSYTNATQLARVHPGGYLLRAWVRTQELTTNEGPRIEIVDPESATRLDVQSEPFTGTRDWTLFEQPFLVSPGTNLVAIRVVRQPSKKFDNKIAGTFWMDSLELTRKQVNY